MRTTLKLTTFCALLLLLCAASAFAQGSAAPVDQVRLGKLFFEQDAKCRGLLRSKQWKEAEAVCRAAVQLADRFADHRELEKMGAYAGVGHALMGQERFKEALGFYTRALEVSRPRLDDTDAETGDMYLNIAMAHHSLGDLGAAREWYGKAEKTYRAAYSSLDKSDVTEEGSEMKLHYRSALRRALELHLRAAEEAGAGAEAKELKGRLVELP